MTVMLAEITNVIPQNSLLLWALLLAAAGLLARLATGHVGVRRLGGALGLAGLVLLAVASLPVGGALANTVYWLLAIGMLAAAAVAISARSPVYMAIWFALSLLGTAGLYLYHGAQFLGVATIAVYAGAIVVIFLFVIMLASPRGWAVYDRVSWAPFAAPLAIVSGLVMVALLLVPAIRLSSALTQTQSAANVVTAQTDHTARFGAALFTKHLVEVEMAGTLLLVALVGAIAIVIHGRTRDSGSNGRGAPSPGGGGAEDQANE